MDKATGGYQKNFALSLILMLTAALTAGCGTGSIFSSGGAGSSAATQTAKETAKPEVAAPTETPSKEPVVVHSPTTQNPEASEPSESVEPEPQEFVGEIELSVEGRPGVEVFYLSATQCEISPDLVQVTGQGFDLSTGEPSRVVINSQPLEELGEMQKFGVFDALGSITVTVADEEYVSDGRMETVAGHALPSMFTYRIEEPGIKYAVSWWSGPTKVSAGYVKVACNH